MSQNHQVAYHSQPQFSLESVFEILQWYEINPLLRRKSLLKSFLSSSTRQVVGLAYLLEVQGCDGRLLPGMLSWLTGLYHITLLKT